MGESQGRSACRRAVVSIVVLAATAAFILAGCSRTAPVIVTSVHVLQTNAFLPLDRTVSDAAKAQRLYDVLQALPTFPRGSFSCSVDWSRAYILTFYREAATSIRAIVQPDGCRAVMLPRRDVRLSLDQFWQVFAEVLDVPESALFPEPTHGPNDSSAPTATPGQP